MAIRVHFALCGLLAGLLAHPSLAQSSSSPPSNCAVNECSRIDFRRTIDTRAVEKFSKPRSFWGKLLSVIAGPGRLLGLGQPFAITEDSRGRLILTDPEFGLVHVLDFERSRHLVLRPSKRETFIAPVGVAVDAADNIYVSDAGRARVYLFGKKGKLKSTLGDEKDGAAFLRPTGVVVDEADGTVYVADTWAHKIMVFDAKGKLLREMGERGTDPGQFNYPTSVALGPEGLYVVDTMNFRLQVLSREGEPKRIIGQQGDRTGTLRRPKGIAVDSLGNIYVVDGLFENVQVFDAEGRLLYYFEAGDGEFAMPSGIHIAPRDIIYIADTLNRRVQVFRRQDAE